MSLIWGYLISYAENVNIYHFSKCSFDAELHKNYNSYLLLVSLYVKVSLYVRQNTICGLWCIKLNRYIIKCHINYCKLYQMEND